MRIFKYTLDVADTQQIEMPQGAKILSCQAQNNEPQLWVLVDDSAPIEARTFTMYGTGHPIENDPGRYVGTYQLHDGALVFHVFESAASA